MLLSIMNFEWDESKNIKNRAKHKIWFEEAQTIWADQNSQEFLDPEHSNDHEERFIRLGISDNSNVLLVVFCERHEDTIRIISARKATKDERTEYEKGI